MDYFYTLMAMMITDHWTNNEVQTFLWITGVEEVEMELVGPRINVKKQQRKYRAHN